MSEKATSETLNNANSNPKKEKPTKEKKVKDKYYAGTNVEKLPKIPKKYIQDLESIEALTPEQLEKYYTAVILGIIPDRFGLEVSVDSKLKAAKGLMDLRENKLKEQVISNEQEEVALAIDFVIKQKEQVDGGINPDDEDGDLNDDESDIGN